MLGKLINFLKGIIGKKKLSYDQVVSLKNYEDLIVSYKLVLIITNNFVIRLE